MSTEINYLILFDKKNFQFNGVERFSKLIGLVEGIEINEDLSSISYNGSEFKYQLFSEGDRFENHETEMFDLVIESKKNESDIGNLSELLREIRTTISNQQGTLTPVFDGISAYYAEKAYPIVHNIENLMRKLYTKFTLIQLGPKWIDSIHTDVGGKQKLPKNGHNPLYDFDFITINDLLFKDYPSKQIDSMVLNKIKQGELKPKDIEKYIPTSNWERYFNDLVECESEYLEKRWRNLYELRNKIAHNKLFTKSDLDNVKKIAEEVKIKLIPALEKISSVSLPPVLNESEIIEGELYPHDVSTADNKLDEDYSGEIGVIATVALVGAFLAAIARA
ncbi:HEPN domain-containing protein [Vibrio rhizosphaerae]|uniref:HEPN domain-containing protein n=1 Tax=Vibrio rhizosphaerae TaxID=398736 RepID=A0ABU4IWJ0_9VIBR|nr:HEPN domain-containing protein [Vibrio rhizosphaerae]MDW6093081.1 HEPN domain-containing protein [Vibrio rhizosphaerae]